MEIEGRRLDARGCVFAYASISLCLLKGELWARRRVRRRMYANRQTHVNISLRCGGVAVIPRTESKPHEEQAWSNRFGDPRSVPYLLLAGAERKQ